MNSEPSSRKDIPLNIQLSAVEKEMLIRLRKDSGDSFGCILREALVNRYRMRFNNEPRCTTGTTCKCPQMHQIQEIDKKTDAELLGSHSNPNG